MDKYIDALQFLYLADLTFRKPYSSYFFVNESNEIYQLMLNYINQHSVRGLIVDDQSLVSNGNHSTIIWNCFLEYWDDKGKGLKDFLMAHDIFHDNMNGYYNNIVQSIIKSDIFSSNDIALKQNFMDILIILTLRTQPKYFIEEQYRLKTIFSLFDISQIDKNSLIIWSRCKILNPEDLAFFENIVINDLHPILRENLYNIVLTILRKRKVTKIKLDFCNCILKWSIFTNDQLTKLNKKLAKQVLNCYDQH